MFKYGDKNTGVGLRRGCFCYHLKQGSGDPNGSVSFRAAREKANVAPQGAISLRPLRPGR